MTPLETCVTRNAGFGVVYDPSAQEELTNGIHPDCPICTETSPYIEPPTGNLTISRRSQAFFLTPGTKPGWTLSLICHGRKTRTKVGGLQLRLAGRAEEPHTSGPMSIMSCVASGIRDWLKLADQFHTLLGCVDISKIGKHIQPTVEIGKFLVLGEGSLPIASTILMLPIAHLAHFYIQIL